MTLQKALLRLVKGGPERQAIEAGEIDAIVDRVNSNVILFPAARRALREIADRQAADQASIGNSLLAGLPHAEYQRLLARLERVTLKRGDVLYESGAPIREAYFPVNCLVSLLTTVKGHEALEVGLVGYEGMVGIALALGVEISSTRALVQATGTAMRIEAHHLRKEILQSIPLQQALFRYKHALLAQVAQTAVCNRFHRVEARLARWLMMACDRVRSSELHLTHELLADMLGVRRVGVTIAASALRKRKLIKYGWGKITILDRKRLAAAACECYPRIKRIYDDCAKVAG